MAITAKMVKELRDKTGAGMMDCKKALEETNGNIEEAIDYLRTKGSADAAKKSARIAAEGSAFIVTDNNAAVILEVNCETDFVTKNEQVKQLLKDLGNHILAHKSQSVEEVMQQDLNGVTVEAHINSFIATIGEKISLRRFALVNKADSEAFGAYVHLDGRIGAVTVLESTDDAELAGDIAMDVDAVNPS